MRLSLAMFLFLFAVTSEAQQNPIRKNGSFNPDIGFNALMLGQASNHGSDPTNTSVNGFNLQEAELILNSDVDTYARLFSTLSIHKTTGWEIEPEELFVESLSFKSVTLKAGKFYAALGKYNNLHTHAFPFIDQNLTNVALFTDEGFNTTGVSASVLLPTSWFSEFTVQAMTNKETAFFGNTNPDAFTQVARLRNLFDLSDSLTMDFGISGASGLNAVNKTSVVGGADITFKWRPTDKGKYSAFIWSTEYLNGSNRGNPDFSSQPLDICTQGGSTFVQWQFAERWWLQGRTEYMDQKIGSGYTVQKRQSALIGFVPTEFSGYRLQYNYTQTPAFSGPDHSIMLQANFSIGAHPAHSY